MAAKCNSCGIQTNFAESFFKARKSFTRGLRSYCPACWQKRQHSSVRWVFLFNLAVGLLGLVLNLAGPSTREMGQVFINLFIFQIFLTLTILPHELGHAVMARWLGMRVFKIYIGSGKQLFTVKLLGFEFEFRAIQLGGLVLAAHRRIEWLRLKQFAFILAGPAVNLLLAAAIWPFLDPDQLWSFRAMERDAQFGLTFFYANLGVLIENLWPHNVTGLFGPVPSDGKQLLLTFFMSREKRQLHHAMNFAMETAVCHQNQDYEGARAWVAKGLALYPHSEVLLSWQGVLQLDLCQYANARECFLQLLQRPSKQPLLRPLMLNNIAFANALLGGGQLLKEADDFSQEAMGALGWMPAVRGTRGTVLAALGRIEEALPLLHQAMEQADTVNHKALNACIISITEAKRGNVVAAREYSEMARRLEPKCSLLARAESVLRAASPPPA